MISFIIKAQRGESNETTPCQILTARSPPQHLHTHLHHSYGTLVIFASIVQMGIHKPHTTFVGKHQEGPLGHAKRPQRQNIMLQTCHDLLLAHQLRIAKNPRCAEQGVEVLPGPVVEHMGQGCPEYSLQPVMMRKQTLTIQCLKWPVKNKHVLHGKSKEITQCIAIKCMDEKINVTHHRVLNHAAKSRPKRV
jgi:hypothetical protein